MSASSGAWVLDGAEARLNAGPFTARCNLVSPHGVGLYEIRYHDAAWTGADLFRVGGPAANTGPMPLEDAYVRGSDLVATYAQTRDKPIRMQVYWRAIQSTIAPPAIGVECIVSVQTSLLDSDPVSRFASRFPASILLVPTGADGFAEWTPDRSPDSLVVQRPTRGCFVVRPANGNWSYVEMVHPADFQQAELSAEFAGGTPVAQLNHNLFAERLEKGVILRARARGWFVPRADDANIARRLYADFAAAEPPLTV